MSIRIDQAPPSKIDAEIAKKEADLEVLKKILDSSKLTHTRDKILGILVTLLVIGIITGMLYVAIKVCFPKNAYVGTGLALIFGAFPIVPLIVAGVVHLHLKDQNDVNGYAGVVYGFFAPADYGWNRERYLSEGVAKREMEIRTLEAERQAQPGRYSK